jgi:hypothetical protein
MADEIHQVGGVFAIVDRERRVQPDLVGVFAQQPRADGVEGAGPGERGARGAGERSRPVRRERLAADALDSPRHLDGGAPRERHQQDAAGIDAVGGEMRHPVGERTGLAGARPGDDEQRRRARLADAVLDRTTLIRVELVEIGRGHRRIALREAKQDEPCLVLVRNRGAGS